MSPRRRGELGLLPLVAIVFFNVSGGPYGIEDAVGTLGPGLVLLLLLVTPIVWSLPVGLVMAELASALPAEGGYVVWVQRAFGRFWGFQAGWWSWINSFVDVAVYPALFADYLAFWRPGMSSPSVPKKPQPSKSPRWMICIWIWNQESGVRGQKSEVRGQRSENLESRPPICLLTPVS